ncbi:alpha-protein kinase 2 [Eucyclogobius newberryi]|uniref:alpha-protein kinase 2 n=1 Tax=Eucyclogobius newberryi TaxID=166745 RepID=UPI003B5C0919
MELILCTDDQSKPQPLSTASAIQVHDVNPGSHLQRPSETAMSEKVPGDISHVFGAEETPSLLPDTESLSIEQNTDRAQSNTPLNMSESFILYSQTTTTNDNAMIEWDCCDLPQAAVPLDGANTSDSVVAAALSTSMTNTPATVPSTAETLSVEFMFSADDCDVGGLLRSLSHHSEGSESDIMPAPLSDLYIFESEAKDFSLCTDPGFQDMKCSQSEALPHTTAADIQFTTHLEASDSSVVTKHEQGVLEDQIIAQYESEERDRMSVEAPVEDACDVAQENTDVIGVTMRNDSPIELWLDACQYFAVENSQGRNLSVPVIQESMSNNTSDYSVSSDETQRSGYSQKACEVIGWSLDDNKSWGAPVERWSSVDSWASALSDWAEIISSPPKDLTAAFTEIGAEIDALTQALAEVTTQIEIGQQSETAKDILEQPIIGVQDKPLDSHISKESSIFAEQTCLTCCLGGEIQEKVGIEPMCTAKVELSEVTRCRSEPKAQSMSSSEGTTPELYSEDRASLSVVPGETGRLDTRGDSFETEVVLNIVEDTDVEFKKTSRNLLNELHRDNKHEVKDISSLDIDRSCAPPETLKVPHQGNNALGFNFLSALTPANLHVREEDTNPGLNVHAFADLDGACQVEPLWGRPNFIMPSALLSIGSSLVTQAASSHLNGDQKATGWALNRDSVYDPNKTLDCQPESDDITDFSDSTEDIACSKQSDTESSIELKSDEVTQCFFNESKTIFEERRDLLNLAVIPNDHFTVCVEKQVACFTLDLFDPFFPLTSKTPVARMPHKTHKSSLEGKTRSKKDRPTGHSNAGQTSKKQDNLRNNVEAEPCTFKENITEEQETRLEHKDSVNVIETAVLPQKETGRRLSKKKKKHPGKTTESLTEVENEAQMEKARSDVLKEKQVTKGTDQSEAPQKKIEKAETKTAPKDKLSQNSVNDDFIKKRRLSQDKFGKLVSSLESKLNKGDTSKAVEDKADVGATRRKAYSEVVKQKCVKPKQDLKVVKPIQAVSVSGDPQSLCLWCQFADVLTDYTVTWRKDSIVLTEMKRSAGDESRVSLNISNASHKDLGKYQCELKNAHGKVTLDFLLTYELLSEVVVPTTPKTTPAAEVEAGHEEESISCSRLMFKEDFLADQYFGESQSANVVTEKVHFGEGMHRRAFRTTLQEGQIPLLVPGHACVLKVHNAISYGTKNNDELVQKNFNLAVEECQVQNTARKYIKAYTAEAQSFEAFGPVPQIIPIYLVHRPSNDIPYATLEEELFGDFVKYSVKDGKEINLMRKDSEAGQKCCAFQHWVYHHTEGNLLVTDMQGVGMKLTDVGIATCKKGYKGFKGNCATSFIDQFKALHQCNTYCEILGLNSLQPKPKKTVPAPKFKAQPGAAPKKKMFEPSLKGKS